MALNSTRHNFFSAAQALLPSTLSEEAAPSPARPNRDREQLRASAGSKLLPNWPSAACAAVSCRGRPAGRRLAARRRKAGGKISEFRGPKNGAVSRRQFSAAPRRRHGGATPLWSVIFNENGRPWRQNATFKNIKLLKGTQRHGRSQQLPWPRPFLEFYGGRGGDIALFCSVHRHVQALAQHILI